MRWFLTLLFAAICATTPVCQQAAQAQQVSVQILLLEPESASALISDPLAALSFTLRLQTHRGDNVPIGLYKDTACTDPATADGDSIAAWRDELSGSGKVATQSNSMFRPTLRFVGGKPFVRSDGVDDHLLITLTAAAGNRSFAVALKPLSTTALQYLFDTESGRLVIAHSFTGNNVAWFDGTSHLIAPATTGAQRLVYIFSGSTGTIYRDNASLGSDSHTATAIGGAVAIQASYSGVGGNFNGDLSALCIIGSALTAGERSEVEAYLSGLQ